MSEDRRNDASAVWSRDEIESPCVRVCVLHPRAGVCMGCYRTGEEIRLWMRYTPAQRREIMNGLAARGAEVERMKITRRGGRAGRVQDQTGET